MHKMKHMFMRCAKLGFAGDMAGCHCIQQRCLKHKSGVLTRIMTR